MGILLSQSKDGDWAYSLIKKWGYFIFRGSSSHGGSSIKSLARHLLHRQAQSTTPTLAGMVLDGPHGPSHLAKQGSEWLAKTTQLKIYAFETHATRCIRLKNWDKTIIPLPFSTVYFKVSGSLIPKTTSEIESHIKNTKFELNSQINTLKLKN